MKKCASWASNDVNNWRLATYKLRNKVQLHKLRHFCSAFSRRHVLPHLGTKCHGASHIWKFDFKKKRLHTERAYKIRQHADNLYWKILWHCFFTSPAFLNHLGPTSQQQSFSDWPPLISLQGADSWLKALISNHTILFGGMVCIALSSNFEKRPLAKIGKKWFT